MHKLHDFVEILTWHHRSMGLSTLYVLIEKQQLGLEAAPSLCLVNTQHTEKQIKTIFDCFILSGLSQSFFHSEKS